MKLKLSLMALAFSTVSAFADAEFPDSNLVTPDKLPAHVLVLAKATCKKNDGLADTNKWNIHKFEKSGANLYTVWCIPAGSNDIRFVVVEPEGQKPFIAIFGKNNILVANARWNEDESELIDISGVNAFCAHQRNWKFQDNKFTLVSEEKLGCE